MDTPSADLVKLLGCSTIPVVAKFAIAPVSAMSARAPKCATLGLRFIAEMDTLVSKLQGTDRHYIRCIKPNSVKKPRQFTGGLVLEQLRFSGIFGALKIRRQGLPFRFSFSAFVRRFKCVFLIEQDLSSRESSVRPVISTMRPAKQCEEILKATGQSFPSLQMVSYLGDARGRLLIFLGPQE